ncbi:hypothetical protein T439DRAFT_325324 [Meredithblackwellia eburnea MCA 4105]
MFRPTLRVLASASRTRTSTGLTGLAVHPAPLPHLLETYTSTLSILSKMPSGAVYRQSVESITKERIEIINKFKGEETEQDITKIENTIEAGLIESVIIEAENELKLAAKVLEWKPWEPLQESPEPGQWAPFSITPSTTSADEL